MKRLIMLVLMIIIKSTAFSQTDIQETKCFTIPVVKTIIKDLISGDSAKAALYLTGQQLSLTEQKLSFKDSVIHYLDEKNRISEEIIRLERVKFDSLFSYTQVVENNFTKVNLQLKVAKAKNKAKNWVIGSGFTIAALYTGYYFLFMK